MENIEGGRPDGPATDGAGVHAASWLTRIVVVVTAALFIAMSVLPDSWEPIENWGVRDAFNIYQGAFWALLSSVFVHGSLVHVGFNLAWIWTLGIPLERQLGRWRWAMLFVGAAWFSSAAQLALSGQTGIGLSGIVYAIFGFMWRTRDRYPSFQAVMTPQNTQIMWAWLIVCFPLTHFGILNIANGAHVAGLVLGVVVAEAVLGGQRQAVIAAAILLIASTATVVYAPWSAEWHAARAVRADEDGDYDEAVRRYRAALELDILDKEWAFRSITRVFVIRRDFSGGREAMRSLQDCDREMALKGETRLFNVELADLTKDGQFDSARELAERAIEVWPKDSNWRYRAGVYANAAGDRTAAARHLRAVEPDWESRFYAVLLLWTIHAREGRLDAANQEMWAYLASLGPKATTWWLSSLARYMLGELEETALLETLSTGDPEQRPSASKRASLARYYIGCKRLVEGDESRTLAAFRACIDAGLAKSYEYLGAQAEIARLDPELVRPR